MNFAQEKMQTITMEIDKALAEDMLSRNIANNRKVKDDWVNALAESMRRGSFLLNPQGIAFDKNGNLIDGQHRLRAVVKSGCTIPMRVTFGCENDSLGVIDAGVKRSAIDVAKMYSEEVHLTNTRIVGMFSSMMYHRNTQLRKSLSPVELFGLIKANENAARILYCCTVAKKMDMFTGEMRAALLEAMLVTGDAQAVFDFRNVYELNEMNPNRNYCNQIVLALRQRLANNKIKRVTLARGAMYNLVQNCFYQFINSSGRSNIRNTNEDRYEADMQVFMNGGYDAQFAGLEVTPNGIVKKTKEDD